MINLDPEDTNKKTQTGLVDGMYTCLPEELNTISWKKKLRNKFTKLASFQIL